MYNLPMTPRNQKKVAEREQEKIWCSHKAALLSSRDTGKK